MDVSSKIVLSPSSSTTTPITLMWSSQPNKVVTQSAYIALTHTWSPVLYFWNPKRGSRQNTVGLQTIPIVSQNISDYKFLTLKY